MENNHPPLVSIVVRTHNRAALLKRAIGCLVEQTYRPIEIFVVDHNSSDDTARVATSFGDIVTYYRHEGSFRDTFNVWRDKVKGEFISVLDDDDYITHDCIAKLAHRLLSDPEIDVVFSRCQFFRMEGDQRIIEKETERVDVDQLKKRILGENVIPWNGVLFRRHCLERVPKIDDSIVGGFDYYFWMLMVLAGLRFYQVDEVLGYIQRSGDSVQFQVERMVTGALQSLEFFGRHLSLREKLALDYFPQYGYRLITKGIVCLENGRISLGRTLLQKGILVYACGIRKRETLVPAVLIWFSCLVSAPDKARQRMEKLFGTYLFRTYHHMREEQGKPLGQSFVAPIISKIISRLYTKEKISISLRRKSGS